MKTEILPVQVLAFGAHPDDVELGCAGTLAKMTRAGIRVGIVDLTAGEMGTRGDGPTRLRESRKAASILGCTFRACLGLPDAKLIVAAEYEKTLVSAIRKARPRIVLAPLSGNTHPDHSAAAELAWAAWTKAGFGKYDAPGRPYRPERFVRYLLGQDMDPSFIVDISGTVKIRRRAVAAYQSQFHNPKSRKFAGRTRLASPHFKDWLDARIRYYGVRILADYGEAFVMKELPEIGHPALLTDRHWVFKD